MVMRIRERRVGLTKVEEFEDGSENVLLFTFLCVLGDFLSLRGG